MGTTEKRETLKTATDVLEHLLKNGRKIKKSKLYQDIRKGILRRNADLSFSVGNVNKYGTTLPMAETPEMVAQEAEEHRKWTDKINARDFIPTDALGLHYVGGADKLKSSFLTEDTHSTGDALLARLFYSYDDKYMTLIRKNVV